VWKVTNAWCKRPEEAADFEGNEELLFTRTN